MTDFELDPRLAQDTLEVGHIAGCRLLLMNDARYPWLILVPERSNLRELHDLNDDEFSAVTGAIKHLSTGLQALTEAPKMNVAALGNQVPMLHIHIIARRPDDPSWPGPVWGNGAAVAYTQDEQEVLIATLQEQLLAAD